MHQPGALGNRLGHIDLVDFLHDPAVVVLQLSRAGDVEHRAFRRHGVGQAGDGVGVAGRGKGTDPKLTRDPSPGVCHMDGRLLVPAVN